MYNDLTWPIGKPVTETFNCFAIAYSQKQQLQIVFLLLFLINSLCLSLIDVNDHNAQFVQQTVKLT